MPRIRKKIVRRRHAKLQLAGAMLPSAGIEDPDSQPVVSRKKECVLDALQIGGFDVRVELREFDGAMVLKSRSVSVRNLDKEDQLAIAAAALEAPSIHFDCDPRYQSLVEREFYVGSRYRPTERRLAMFAQPLIEGDSFKGRVQRSSLAGRLSYARSAEAKDEYETSDHSITVPHYWVTGGERGVLVLRL